MGESKMRIFLDVNQRAAQKSFARDISANSNVVAFAFVRRATGGQPLCSL